MFSMARGLSRLDRLANAGKQGLAAKGRAAKTSAIDIRRLYMVRFAVLGLFAACLAWVPAAPAPAAEKAGITVENAWVRASLGKGLATAGYMTVIDQSGQGDELVGLDAVGGGKAEVHESVMKNGVMSMRRQDKLPVPAGGRLELKPAGAHIMIMGAPDLKTGDTFPITLRFKRHGDITVNFAVRTK